MLLQSMTMNTEAQLRALKQSLERFGATDPCPWELASTFNLLLEEAKKEASGNPVVAAMEPAQSGPDAVYATMNAGALTGLTLQLYRALSRD